jgi:amidohydrolase
MLLKVGTSVNPIDYIKENQELIFNCYQDLHHLAEPSWKEEKTSRYIAEQLKKVGINVKTFRDHYGIIAEIPGKENQVIALRADLDALVQEVNGKVRPNHSCGHDGHSTMVLFTALALKDAGILSKHTLRFIFQPAEELGSGALQMMKDGALENVKYLFGIHLRPHFEVPYQKAAPVIVHGSVGTLVGSIKGIQAHASRPQDGINAIEVAAEIVCELAKLQLPDGCPFSVKMTKLNTPNESSNVIPETATFTLDIRAQTNEGMQELQKMLKDLFAKIERNTGAAIRSNMEMFVPAAVKHSKAMEVASSAITEILGVQGVVSEVISQGAEDFHFYTQQTPGLAATMIGLGCDLKPGLHHPNMTFRRDALLYGTQILIKTMLNADADQN